MYASSSSVLRSGAQEPNVALGPKRVEETSPVRDASSRAAVSRTSRTASNRAATRVAASRTIPARTASSAFLCYDGALRIFSEGSVVYCVYCGGLTKGAWFQEVVVKDGWSN